jgi:hypothetical protein
MDIDDGQQIAVKDDSSPESLDPLDPVILISTGVHTMQDQMEELTFCSSFSHYRKNLFPHRIFRGLYTSYILL